MIVPDTTEAKLRELPAVTHDLHLDLKLSSDEDLLNAIQQLENERSKRHSIAPERLLMHFDHIEDELRDTVEACQLSIEHLELYRNYMLRYQATTLSPKFERRRVQLLKEINTKLTQHQLSSFTRSGDMASAVAVATRNLTQKR
jgi:hypothetical protein